MTRAHLDATGIGAIACGRHSCFYPRSVVNFEKGEGLALVPLSFSISNIQFLDIVTWTMHL